MSADLSDIERGFLALLRGIPREAASILERNQYRVSAYIVAGMDEAGPAPGVKSTSPRLAIRSGRYVRGTVPGEAENISEITVTDAETLWQFGPNLDVIPYPMFHEFADEFDLPYPSRPTFYPGVERFIEKEMPLIEREVGDEVVNQWGRG